MKIHLTRSDLTIEIKEINTSLLDVLEENNIQVEYQCREGYCGSCRCKLISGEVEWVKDPLAFMGKGEILPCCVKAKGDIEVEL
uniref:Ferredoxin n=1 Tax=Pantoea phage Survivor TaxID=3232176 RepID=A0AAU8L0N6_9CAUD